MALNSTGAISLGGGTAGQSINLEFGRGSTAQVSMSQLYRGGGIIPNTTQNNAIATSGQIDFNSFHGAVNRVAINLTISSNTQNYNIYNNRGSSYVAGASDITLTVNAVVGASSTGVFAMTVGSFVAGDTVTIINNSYIVGCGGQGGFAGGVYTNGGNGAGAGPALNANRAVTIYNYGVIGGGGGGGAGSGGNHIPDGGYGYIDRNGQGGGGGAGNSVGPASNNGSSAGGFTTGGGGGGAYYIQVNLAHWMTIGAGGAGGSLGNNGGGAQASYSASFAIAYYSGAVGGGGACTSGNGNITWAATGTRYGALN